MRTIAEIYSNYKIMPPLEMHMLRVAAVASLVCDNFSGQIKKEEIVTACLFHDMGNIIKTDFSAFPEEFYAPQGTAYWQSVKEEYIAKYGENEHKATLAIMKEINLPENVISLGNSNRFTFLCAHKESENMAIKITHYADMRTGPFGVVSYDDRMKESGKRYGEKLGPNSEREKLVACGREIEKQIFEHCRIRPEDITEESVAPIIEELKNFSI